MSRKDELINVFICLFFVYLLICLFVYFCVYLLIFVIHLFSYNQFLNLYFEHQNSNVKIACLSVHVHVRVHLLVQIKLNQNIVCIRYLVVHNSNKHIWYILLVQ